MRPPRCAPRRGVVAAATALAFTAAVILGLAGHLAPGLAVLDCGLAAVGAAADGPAVPAASASRSIVGVSGRQTSGGTAACQTDLLRVGSDVTANVGLVLAPADRVPSTWRRPGPSRAPPRGRSA